MTEAFDYTEFNDTAGTGILEQISELAREMKKAELEVAQAEDELRIKQAMLVDIAQVRLPALMDEAKMAKFTTTEGFEVTIAERIAASIPKGAEHEAFAWLEEHNHGNLIKNEFKVEFGKNQEQEAKQFEEQLLNLQNRPKFSSKRGVNFMTLSSFVKEQLEKGVDIPLAVFGAHLIRVAKLKLPK